ncbi:response regulator [Nigerium massiliense]|uniref:response regulator n=1 Tax=Nigerium massiliense TaxID=1522317 RepID=UPI000590EE1F|nr:response regulator transcription factor [Nigerium massiliense]
MSADAPVRVLLADDQALFRNAIGSLLNAQPDFEVVGEAGNGLAAVERARALQPDIVVLDVEMPIMDGVEAARVIRETLPAVKVVMLTVCVDDDRLLNAIRLGVHGYLLKDLRPEELFDLLRSVMTGQTPVSPVLVTRLLAELRSTTNPAAGVGEPTEAERRQSLSRRELEILQLVARGLSNREIGRSLSITEGTVKNHVHNALHKLHMDNRIQAAAYIVREGLAVLPS